MSNIPWFSNEGAHVLIEHLQDGIYVIENGKLSYLNQRMADMLGYTVNELIGFSFIKFIAPEDQAIVMERYSARISGEQVPEQYEIRLRTAQDKLIYCSINIGLKTNPDGTISTIGSIRDITNQKIQLAELTASQLELKSVFDHLPDVYYRTNMEGIITMISPSCYELIGYRQEVLLGTLMANYYKTPEERQKIVQAITAGNGKATRVEAALKHKDGSIIWISTSAAVHLDANGNPVYIEGVARDISDRKRMEEQLTTLSRIDNLTDIYNRSYFMDKCNEVLALMKRYQRPSSMVMMDIDHFKSINDSYGHHVGDMALIAFTMECQKEIRESDIFGRLGGEEFGLLLPETTIENAQILAERIRLRVSNINIPVADKSLNFTVSIGLVEVNMETQNLDNAINFADKAMYKAKENGRNQVVIYNDAF